MKRCCLLLLCMMCASASAGIVLSMGNDGYLSWTGGGEFGGYYRIQFYRGAPTNALEQWDYTAIANNGAISQTLDMPWAFRLAWSTNAYTDTDEVIPSDWHQMPARMEFNRATWDNLDDVTGYALGWKLSATDAVWRLNWSDYLNLAPSATGLVRLPLLFGVFLRRVYVDQPPNMARPIPLNFVMGDTFGSGVADESPTRNVTLTRYLIGQYEVTEGEWENIRTWGMTHGYTDLVSGVRNGTNYPVRGVSWLDAVKWCNAKSEHSGEIPEYRLSDNSPYRSGTNATVRIDVNGYRLPTEAEWERAAKASGTVYGPDSSLVRVWAASYSSNLGGLVYTTNATAIYRGSPHTSSVPVAPVGSIARSAWSSGDATDITNYYSAGGWTDANPLGMHDVSGNVMELCDDWYGPYDPSQLTDPRGPTSGLRRVVRGGAWSSKPNDLRVTARNSIRPNARNRGVGFRYAKRPWANEDGSNMLVVYNTNDGSSASLANYYVSTRGGITGATLLAVSTTTNEVMDWSEFTNNLYNPVIEYLTSHPDVRYVVMMYGLPTRLTGGVYNYNPGTLIADDYGISASFAYQGAKSRFLHVGFPRTRALVTYLTGRCPADVSNYISRVAAHHATKTRISGSQTNGWYVFDDVGGFSSPGYAAYAAVEAENTNALLVYSDEHITDWTNLTGYLTWGWNGGYESGWATNGTITFHGTNWYIIETVESYNGLLDTFQSSVYDWLSPGAFGGTNYENCPIGAVCHVEEPYIGGINGASYFELWERGLAFAECAWASRQSSYMMAVGDPLVTK